MPNWTCSHCHASNAPPDRTCEACGQDRAVSPTRPCPFDGASLHANGFCPTGNGFPISLRACPDACPHCRHPLRWDGDCQHCVPPGEKPGHRYDYTPFSRTDPTSAHWRIADRGPHMIAPPTPEHIPAAIQRAFAPATPRALPILQPIRELTRL